MNGPEHYREAEAFLGHAAEARADRDYESVAHFLGHAQTHALLALTAATAANIRRNGALPVDAQAWAPTTAITREES